MCIKCAIGMSNETIKNQLEDVIEKKNFDKLNTTGVKFILYACVGIFGYESKEVGLKLIKMFIEWLKDKNFPYLPYTGIEEMYHYTVLTVLVEWCESSNFEVCNEDDENKRMELFNLLINKMNDLLSNQ